MKSLLSVMALFALALASAQDYVIEPRSIIVNPHPEYEVDVWVDRDPRGTQIPTYTIGDSMRVGVSVSENAYVYLFNVNAVGEIQQILPNRVDPASEDNFLRAGETRTFPPEGARYTYTVGGPAGLDKIIAVASRRPLDTTTLARFETGEQFATSDIGEEGFARGLSIIVEPLPGGEWVTDTVLFHVVRAGQAPSRVIYGTLDIRSQPAGARAYVNDQYVGLTPVRYGAAEGSHEVRLELGGYEPFRTQVSLRGGATELVEVGLSPVRRTGTVTFRSEPSGAEVFVDGQRMGTTPLADVTLDEGNYQVRFRMPGHEEQVLTISVQAGRAQTVSPTLRALRGALVVQANVGGARVFVNGNEVGAVPSGTGRLHVPDLPAGTHELTVVAPGYGSVIRDFEIRGGETAELQISQIRR
jgi:hypothetical protein